jgi:Flp pilus assembly pilin Flp
MKSHGVIMIRFSKQHVLTRFRDGESGAITIDWVVLTAALTLFGVAAAFYVNTTVPELAEEISTFIDNIDP